MAPSRRGWLLLSSGPQILRRTGTPSFPKGFLPAHGLRVGGKCSRFSHRVRPAQLLSTGSTVACCFGPDYLTLVVIAVSRFIGVEVAADGPSQAC